MTSLGPPIRLLLALVFGVAAIAKLVDQAETRRAMREFGVPPRLSQPVALIVPAVELATALLLLPASTGWLGAFAAIALLLVFTFAVLWNLARGRRPECHCFGQLSSSPVSWRTIARNLMLAGLASFILLQNSPSLGLAAWFTELSELSRAVIALALLIALPLAVTGWALLNVVAQQGRLLLRIEALENTLPTRPNGDGSTQVSSGGLPIGTPAPTFSLPGLHGETLTLNSLASQGKPMLLVFADPGCGPCNDLLPEIGDWQTRLAHKLNLVVLSRGSAKANLAKAKEYGLSQVLRQTDREVAEAYAAHGTPSAVLVSRAGAIASGLAQGAEAIRALVKTAADGRGGESGSGLGHRRTGHEHHGSTPRSALDVGDPAPNVVLPDLDGRTVTLDDYRGHDTLLLFWRPSCGFCQRMLEDLKAWENRPRGRELLVVSTGPVEENRGMDLRSTVLLEEGFSVGQAFGATGTPSAILVDGGGRIASGLAVGADAVLKLARSEQ